MLLLRTWVYRDRAQVSHPPHRTPQNELIRITSGQHRAQERQPSVGNRDAAKSHNPCDSIQTQLRGVLGWPISLAWGKALDLETCARNAQEALATHPFCHHHSPTQAGWPGLPVAAAPASGTTSYAQGQTSLSWVGARARCAGSGDPHSHIDTPLPRAIWPRPLCYTRAGPRPTLHLGHSRSSINIYGRAAKEIQQRTLHSSKEMCP